MTVDEELKAYANTQKRCDVKEEKLVHTIQKSKEAFWEGEEQRNVSWLEFLHQQASYIRKFWWLAQGLALAILWFALYFSDSNIYEKRCMGILAPIFAILLLPELWKNRDSDSMEVEGAAYFSLQKIYAARMILFGMVDVGMLSVFIVISTVTVQITIMDILIQFLLPLNVTCCICFQTLCSKKDSSVFYSLTLCFTWLAVWMFVVLRYDIYEKISQAIWMGAVLFSVIYLCYSVMRVWKHCEDYYESSSAVRETA